MKKAGLLLIAGTLLLSLTGCHVAYKDSVTVEDGKIVQDNPKTVINVIYTDEKYKEYFEYCEQAFEKANTDVDIKLDCVEETTDYIQNIVQGSYSEDTTIDVYMLSDSKLGTAYLAGVTLKNPYEDFSEDNYCQTALFACSHGENLIAYPLSYDTAFLVYRSDFMSSEDVKTFENIEAFAENADYSSEELSIIESIFRCDLGDIFINYGFVGAGINLGGDTGSDASVMEIATGETIKSAYDYTALIDYFSIGSDENYGATLYKFTSGKYLSTIASTYSLNEIFESGISYGIGAFPDYNDIDTTSPLSITHCLVVNQCSDYTDVASDFARFATYEAASLLYEKAGVLSARKNIKYENTELENIYASYEKASGKNKLQYGEQVYPLIEIAMHNIVAGNNAKEEFESIEEYMSGQLE